MALVSLSRLFLSPFILFLYSFRIFLSQSLFSCFLSTSHISQCSLFSSLFPFYISLVSFYYNLFLPLFVSIPFVSLSQSSLTVLPILFSVFFIYSSLVSSYHNISCFLPFFTYANILVASSKTLRFSLVDIIKAFLVFAFSFFLYSLSIFL